MRDPSAALRTAIVQNLQGQILHGGQAVPVWASRVPTHVNPPYIYVPSQQVINDSAKDYFATNSTVTVEVVYRSETGVEQSEVDNLSDQVLQILAAKDQIDMPHPSGFHTVDFTLVSVNQLVDYDDEYTYLRKVLVFDALIDEG